MIGKEIEAIKTKQQKKMMQSGTHAKENPSHFT